MKLNLNNSELVAIFRAIETFLEISNDKMVIESLLSVANKINNNSTIFNPKSEEWAVEIKQQIEEILELMEDE